MPEIPNTGNNGLVLTSVGNGSNASQWSKASNSSLVGIPSMEISSDVSEGRFGVPPTGMLPPLPQINWQIGNIYFGTASSGDHIGNHSIVITTPGVYVVNASASFFYGTGNYNAFVAITASTGGSTGSTKITSVPPEDVNTTAVLKFINGSFIYVELFTDSAHMESCNWVYLNATLISQE